MRLSQIVAGAFTGICLTAFVACATIMHGTREGIPISSQPSGAMVTVDDTLQVGATPVSVELRRKNKTHKIKLELAGYEPFEMATTRRVSGWVWGNIVFGGLIGLVVDAATGGLYNVKPETVVAELRKQGISQVDLQDGTLVVILVPKANPDWQLIGHLAPHPR